jgi:hypothetical protein
MMTALDDDSDRSRLSEMELMGNILTVRGIARQ